MNKIDIQRPTPLTVSQLTNAIKMSLEATFPVIHLQGEISNIKVQSSGHLYFSLKDAQAMIGAVMFKGEASLLKVVPKVGDQVIVKGELTVYPPKGNYQLVVRELSYLGLGELLLKLEELKVKLHQLGWFKSARKKPLPRFPRTIGVVTSPTGAVIQDILNVLARRFSGFHLILNPVKVQGEGAAQEIAQAIEQFNRYNLAEVLIVGRGGGSLEDLWAFNEEVVAAAIFQSQIPIISAVGHETDHCIADYVSDVRAPTPSAAAEIVIAEKNQQIDYLAGMKKRIVQTLAHLIQQYQTHLKAFVRHPLFVHPFGVVELRMQQLDDKRIDLLDAMLKQLQMKRHLLEVRRHQVEALKPTNQISFFKQRLCSLEKGLEHGVEQAFEKYRHRLTALSVQIESHCKNTIANKKSSFSKERLTRDLYSLMKDRLTKHYQKIGHIANMLQALDPKNLLQKGYSILFDESSNVINSVAKLHPNQQVKLLLSDGEASLTVNPSKF